MTNRRFFLLGAAAVLATPAIVRAESIMRVVAPKLIVPEEQEFIFRTEIPVSAWRMYNQGTPYGRSPAMDALEDVALLQRRIQAMALASLKTPTRKWFTLDETA